MAKVYDNATDLITFARSSSGTALRRVGYGDELFVSAATSSPSVVDNGDGSYTFDVTGGVNASVIVVDALTTGKVYRVGFTLSDWTSGNLAVSMQTWKNGGQYNANGTYEVFVVAESGDTEANIQFDRSGSTVAGTVSNISVKEVIFDRPTDDLVLFNHPDDIPRIEYAADGSLKGLLIEEQRTNLITNSTPQSGDLATSGGSFSYVTCNFTPLSGLGVHFDTTGVTSYVYFRPTHTVDDYTFSVFVEMDDGNAPTFGSSISPDASNDFAFVVDGGPVNPASYIVEHYGGSTYRVSGTRSSVNTTARNAGLIKYSGNSSRTFKVTGFQLEQGSFATSYIPTSGSTVTRSPDIASIPVSAFGYNQDAWTIVVEFGAYDVGTNAASIVSVTDNPVTNDWVILYASPSEIRMDVQATGVRQALLIVYGDRRTTGGIAGIAVKENAFAFTIDGSAPQTDSSGTMPTDISIIRIGSFASNPSFLNGHIKSLKYYPRCVTNTQLQELTS